VENLDYQKNLEEARKRLPEQYHQYMEIFAPKYFRLPEHGPYDLAINLKEGKELPRQKQRPMSREENLETIRQTREWIRLGRVQESRSKSAVPVLFVPKEDGSKRMCIDLRPVNAATIRDENKAPLQEQVKDRLLGAKYITRLDIRDGYHRLRIKEGDEWKTAFITPIGLYEFKVVCFGLANAPAEFARFINHVLGEFVTKFVTVYFDDITIHSQTLEEHRQHVLQVLKRLSDEKITLKITKCEFDQTEVKLLGEIVSGTELKMQEEKVKAILNWPEPDSTKNDRWNRKNLEKFRGLAGYYRKYIQGYSNLLEPINKLIHSEEKFKWTELEKEVMNTVKKAFVEQRILKIFDYEKPVRVTTDASGVGIGGMIEQQDEENHWKPILFCSRKMNNAELRYSTPDKELLAIVHMFRKYPHYLKGTKHTVLVRTDHQNLRTFTTKKKLLGRQVGWMEELADANMVIEHIKGKENIVTDALSRRPDYLEEQGEYLESTLLKEEDGFLKVATSTIISTTPFDEMLKEIQKESIASEREDITFKNGMQWWKNLIIVPKQLREKIIEYYHNDATRGHPGIERTIEKITRKFYFPRMTVQVKKYIARCEECQKNKDTRHRPYGKMQTQEIEATPWATITMDFLSGMPKSNDPITGTEYHEILVIVDKLTKYCFLLPTKEGMTARQLAQLLLRQVFTITGMPRKIISDRDKLLRSEFWQELMKIRRVDHQMSTAHHQQTDGQTERKIQELIQYLRHYLDFNQENWVEILPVAQHALNDNISTVTGLTPNEAIYGKNISLTWEPNEKEDRMIQKHQQIAKDIRWEAEEMKQYYDRKREDAPNLKEGDRVYIRRRTTGSRTFNIKSLRPSQKLDCVKYGPFTILEKQRWDNYKIQLPSKVKLHPIFHISFLEPTNNPTTQSDEMLREEEWEVEKIIGKRMRRGRKEYKVHWMEYGSEDDSWEPATNLNCPEKITEYEKENC
jgi:transposase InsO family protein